MRDSQLMLSDGQAVTSTAISENVLDLNPVGGPNAEQNIGVGEEAYLVVETTEDATDTGSDATLTVSLESDSTADLATSATVHFSTGALAFADFSTAGTRLAVIKLPQHLPYERYLGVRYTVGSGPLTAGNFDAYITKDIDAVTNYATNVNLTV